MKYILLLPLILISMSIFVSCEDHFETGIEGSWQMTHVTQIDGTEIPIDTIFYRFKKGVFEYQISNKGHSFGMYEKKGDSLFITMKEYLGVFQKWNPWDGELSRNYKIEKLESKKMILKYDNELYHFRIF